MTVAHAMHLSSDFTAMAVVAAGGYDATMPIVVPGMVVVQAGEPVAFRPGMAMGVVLSTKHQPI